METRRPAAGELGLVWSPRGRRSDGARLRAVIEAHLRYEQTRGVRRVLGAVEISLGVPLWLAAARPAWFSADVHRFVLTISALGFAAFFAAVLAEARCLRACGALTDGGEIS